MICLKCNLHEAQAPNTWCTGCVEASRMAWERTKQALGTNYPRVFTQKRCMNCGIPMDVSLGAHSYCNLCCDLYLAVSQRPHFERLHREWAYGQTL